MTERETTVAEMLETMVDEQTKLITSGNDTETKELKVLLDGCRIFEEFKGALCSYRSKSRRKSTGKKP